jgi:hypothetical protein
MFNGTPILQQISPTELRITGVTLSANTAGTIGFASSSGTPDIVLPASFEVPSATFEDEPVPLRSLVKVDVNPESPGPFTNLPPSIQKTGETGEDFLITITNTKVDATTQTLEIYLTLLGQTAETGNVVVNVQNSPNTTVNISTDGVG